MSFNLRRTAVALVLGVALGTAGSLDSGSVRLTPGEAVPVTDVLAVTDPRPGAASFGQALMVSVVVGEVTTAEEWWCRLVADCTLVPAPPDRPGEDTWAHARAQASGSVDAADAAVDAFLAGVPGGATHPEAPGNLGDMSGVGGPSAGLTLALHLLSQRLDGDLFAGRTVAATGTIDAAGNVGPIGAVDLKLVAVEAAGADVFFVPVDSAPVADLGVRVVRVRHFDDAVAWLCRTAQVASAACR